MILTTAACLIHWSLVASAWAAPISPEARWGHILVYVPTQDHVLLFGGSTAPREYREETWILTAQGWRQLAVPGPSARGFPAATWDPERRAVLVHGGRGLENETLSDLWAWDGEAWRQLEETSPLKVDHHEMVHVPNDGGLLVFGGWTGQRVSGETWFWDGTWTQVARRDAGPPARGAFGMAWNAARERVELHGGLWINGQYADSWAWSGGRWESLTGPYDNSSLDHHEMFFDAGSLRMLVYGGKDYRYTARDEARVLDEQGLVSMIHDHGPPPRHSTAIAWDSRRGRAILFGGKTYEARDQVPLGDLWYWSGGGWSEFEPEARP